MKARNKATIFTYIFVVSQLLFTATGCDNRHSTETNISSRNQPVTEQSAAKKITDQPALPKKTATVSPQSDKTPSAPPTPATNQPITQEFTVKTTPADTASTVESPTEPSSPEPQTTPSDWSSIDARQIVKISDDLMRGDTNQGLYTMAITTPSWSRTLELDVYTKGRDKVFIRILSPAKEAGTGTLRIENEMWNYLPRIEKIIKIPPSMMLQPWMGSDFANDDLVKQNSLVEDYTHTIVAEEEIRGHQTYKIELKPKPNAAVIWGKLYYWLRVDDNVPIRQEFFSERGELVKRLEYSDIEKVSDRVIPRTWHMTNLVKDGKSTRIFLKDVRYNEPVSDNIFTRSNLKRIK